MNRLFPLVILVVYLEGGCSQQPTPPPRGVTVWKENDENIQPNEFEQDLEPDGRVDKRAKKPAVDAWTYKSIEGFQFSLPKGWKQKPGKEEFFGFSLGSPMLCSVKMVRKESFEQFRKTVGDYWDFLRKSPDQVKDPKFEKGKTKSGSPCSFAVLYEKGQKSDTYYYFASSHTWLKAKELTVQLIFEGQGKMQSRIFKASEHSAFATAARTICLSVKEMGPE